MNESSASSTSTDELPDPYDDAELLAVIRFFEHSGRDLVQVFGSAMREGIDAIIDTANTGRWSLEDCANVEKTYLGYKIENLIRAIWHFEQRLKGMDYVVDGIDVDCKWSKSWGGWMIPKEAVGELCLLTWADDRMQEMAVGLIRAHREVLTKGENQGDKKKSIQAEHRDGRTHWLVPRQKSLPENFLLALDEDDRRAILAHKGGDARAKELFVRCEGVVIRRHTIESVGQQRDDGRRFRGETRRSLSEEHGLELLKAPSDRLAQTSFRTTRGFLAGSSIVGFVVSSTTFADTSANSASVDGLNDLAVMIANDHPNCTLLRHSRTWRTLVLSGRRACAER